jgi:gamma-glutamylcyclotransferase (GGCT)/AIG2-like uncharacterized protein YtfP
VIAEPSLVFVYGTLQPGEERWPILAPLVLGEGRATKVAGDLYDTGEGYPAALFPDDTEGLITGRVFTMRQEAIAEALAVLDEVEAAVEGLYRRIVVETIDGDRAWAYEYGDGPGLVPIRSGDWLRHREEIDIGGG